MFKKREDRRGGTCEDRFKEVSDMDGRKSASDLSFLPVKRKGW